MTDKYKTMDLNEFNKFAHEIVDWITDYYRNIEDLPVKSPANPGDIIRNLPPAPPAAGEKMDDILSDFNKLIMPGITHWQSPDFFAYFPANSSYPSLLAEFLTAAIGAQCMSWETSPAATELEEQMMNWLRGMIGLPQNWTGVIQDTASTSTLAAFICARERATTWMINDEGFPAGRKFRIYCSSEAHSSIEKGAKIAGIGSRNVVRIAVDSSLAMIPEELDKQIRSDLSQGWVPLCIVAAIGTTGTTAIDPLLPIAKIAEQYKIWLHIDAAFAGTALLLPEYRWMIDGIELADSFVFNPHKWMFTNFDCSAYFVRDKESLVRTFEILPEYLKTASGNRVNNYRDWGIPLGRRFRALKLWFVIRSFGVEGLQERIRKHISMAEWLEAQVRQHPDFELMAPRSLNLVCFRYNPAAIPINGQLDKLNMDIKEALNADGSIYLTHTKVNGSVTLRMVIAQTDVSQHHVEQAWQKIITTAASLG
jgi:aromatic-L-amino-acid/L-tryptophan decarboxylase